MEAWHRRRWRRDLRSRFSRMFGGAGTRSTRLRWLRRARLVPPLQDREDPLRQYRARPRRLLQAIDRPRRATGVVFAVGLGGEPRLQQIPLRMAAPETASSNRNELARSPTN